MPQAARNRRGQLASMGAVGVEPSPGCIDPAAGARHQLAARDLGPVDDGGDLVVGIVEDVMEEEHGTFHRLELLEQDQEGQGQGVGQFGTVIRRGSLRLHRLGQPRSLVRLATDPRRAQLVDAEAGHDRRQIRRRCRHLALTASGPPHVDLLDHVFGLGGAPEHAVGHGEQRCPESEERLEVAHVRSRAAAPPRTGPRSLGW